MGQLVPLRKKGRPYAPESADDLRDEVTALRAETLDLVAAARPIVAQLAMYGQASSPAVLARASALGRLLERAERRALAPEVGAA